VSLAAAIAKGNRCRISVEQVVGTGFQALVQILYRSAARENEAFSDSALAQSAILKDPGGQHGTCPPLAQPNKGCRAAACIQVGVTGDVPSAR